MHYWEIDRKKPSIWRESNPQSLEFLLSFIYSTAVLQPLPIKTLSNKYVSFITWWIILETHSITNPKTHRTVGQFKLGQFWGICRWDENSTSCPPTGAISTIVGRESVLGEASSLNDGISCQHDNPVWGKNVPWDFCTLKKSTSSLPAAGGGGGFVFSQNEENNKEIGLGSIFSSDGSTSDSGRPIRLHRR